MGRSLMLWAFALFVAASMLAGSVSNANADCCVVTLSRTFPTAGGMGAQINLAVDCGEIFDCLDEWCDWIANCVPDLPNGVRVSGTVKTELDDEITEIRRYYTPKPIQGCPPSQHSVKKGFGSGLPWAELHVSGGSGEFSNANVNLSDLAACLECFDCDISLVEAEAYVEACLSSVIDQTLQGSGGVWQSQLMGPCPF